MPRFRQTSDILKLMTKKQDISLKSMDTDKKIYGLAAEAGIKKAFIIGKNMRKIRWG